MGIKSTFPSSEEWGHDNTEMGDFPGQESAVMENDHVSTAELFDEWAI
jgi:hypothetical protein